MKLLHFADMHVGMENYSKLDPETGLSSRLLEFFEVFDFIIDQALTNKVDAVLFAGDAYKTRDPNPTQQRGFGERIRKIAKNGIPVVLVVGNHDTPNATGKANTLDIYSALEIDNVFVSRTPEIIKLETKSGPLQVVTLPWLAKEDYKTVGERLNLLYEKINEKVPAILVSHAEVEGSSFGSEKGLAITNDVTVPLTLLQDRRLSYVALGHIHKYQVLSNPPKGGPLVVYSGSPVRIDFGEEKEEKGVVLVELGSSSKQTFIPTPAKEFCTITISLSADDPDPTQTVLAQFAKTQISGKIVRVIINIPADCQKELEMDKVKKALAPAFVVAGISRNIERKERARIEGVEETERLTPLEALQKYFASKMYSPEKQKLLEKYAQELLDK